MLILYIGLLGTKFLRMGMSKLLKLYPEHQFSKIRTVIWPIKNSELKKFVPMGIMMFIVLFNYTLLRNAKDALVITSPACGAEIIPFLKLFGVMPCAILFFFIYTKLSNLLSQESLFYICLIPFLAFFTAFAFIIYPNKELIHPTFESISALRELYPNIKWIISLYGIWSYAIFYILSELWGSIVVCLLFWQFANKITTISEAKRFYSLFGLLGNFALIASGSFAEWLAESSSEIDMLEKSIFYMMSSIVILGICILSIYWWMNRYILTDHFYYSNIENNKMKKKDDKLKLSLKESLYCIFTSKYLGFITILVVSYGISSNLIDVTWKSQIKEYFPNSNDYFAFMGRFSFWTGITTIIFIVITKGGVQRFGWFVGAIATPIMYIVTSALFFAFMLFKDVLENIIILSGVTSVYMAVIIGAVQNILSKGMKYSLFDPTKEMSYIPLDKELKVKGKAAVDIIGGRLGKSSGGFIQFILLTITSGNQLTIAPYLFGIVIMIIVAWVGAVKGLSKLYNAKVAEKEA